MKNRMETILKGTNFSFAKQTGFSKDNTRDLYLIEDFLQVEIFTDRIVVDGYTFQNGVTYFGQILKSIGSCFEVSIQGIFQTNLLNAVDIRSTIRYNVTPVFEVFYGTSLIGPVWEIYLTGKRKFGTNNLADNLIYGDKLDFPVVLFIYEGQICDYDAFSQTCSLISDKLSLNFLVNIHDLFNTGRNMLTDSAFTLEGAFYQFGFIGNELVLIHYVHLPINAYYYFTEKSTNLKTPLNCLEYFQTKTVDQIQNKPVNFYPFEPAENLFEEYSELCIKLYLQITKQVFEPYKTNNLTAALLKNIHDLLKTVKGIRRPAT